MTSGRNNYHSFLILGAPHDMSFTDLLGKLPFCEGLEKEDANRTYDLRTKEVWVLTMAHKQFLGSF